MRRRKHDYSKLKYVLFFTEQETSTSPVEETTTLCNITECSNIRFYVTVSSKTVISYVIDPSNIK